MRTRGGDGEGLDDFSDLFEKLEVKASARVEVRDALRKAQALPRDAAGMRERIWAMQLARDADLLTHEDAFCLVGGMIHMLAEDRHGERYEKAYSQRFAACESDEERDALNIEFEAAMDRMTVETFREFGEEAMAELYERDADEFFARLAAWREKRRR